jgi:iron complex transport system substrate-binding protein
MRRTFLALLAVVALSWSAAACGDDDDVAVSGTTTPTTADEATDGGFSPFHGRIVSLSATATEILFAIGADDQVVAVDDTSDYPPEVPKTDLSGFQPNIEAIAGYEPDLVVISYDPGDLVDGLEALGIDVVEQPAVSSIDEAYDQIEELGELTGHDDEAGDLVDEIRTELDELAASVPARSEPLTYYHELDDTLYTVTSDTFTAEVYRMAGLTNIADEAQSSGGSVQLSNEFVVAQDPDLVFLADTECCGVTATSVAARPGWAGLRAVAQGTVVELDDDIASRWGPRVVDFLRVVIDAVELVPAA